MKIVPITIAGKERYLLFNGIAMFAIDEEFGGTTELMEAIGKNDEEGYRNICKVIALLAEQGELARRYYGHDSQEILSADDIEVCTIPADIVRMRLAIPLAISAGFGREIKPENEEIDLGLLELNQKKTTK